MFNSNAANQNGKESPLAFIITHTRTEFDLGRIYQRLSDKGFGFVTVEDYNTARRHRIFYLDQVREELLDIRMLIAGRGIPLEQMLHVAPNLRTVYTTDPSYRYTRAMANGGPNVVSIVYIDSKSPVSNNHATQMILNYLDGLPSPSNAQPTIN